MCVISVEILQQFVSGFMIFDELNFNGSQVPTKKRNLNEYKSLNFLVDGNIFSFPGFFGC